MQTPKLLSLAFLVIFLTQPFFNIAFAASPQPETPPFFTEAECMFPVPASAQVGKDLVCGYLTVPERHADPSGRTIRLAVVIIKSLSASPRPDPLVMAQGGPGGSTIDTYVEQLLRDESYRREREIVLFDQRGTLYSQPNLVCEETQQLVADTIEKELSSAEADRLYAEALLRCRQHLLDSGVNLAAFNSLENAADIDDLRRALGYQQINLYGVSYGTLLALHTLRDYSSGLRSVILDSVVPPQINFLLRVPQTMDRAFTHLFQACQADPACDRYYPNLEQVFQQVYDDLEKNPARWPMTDPETGTTYPQAVIDGETFLYGLFQMLYAGSLIPALPRAIYEARDRQFGFFARILSILVFDRSMADGMYYSVLCAEDADFTPSDQSLEGIRPLIQENEAGDAEQFLQICQRWGVPYLGPELDEPVRSQVPTLVLSGAFDPVTPPEYGAEAAQTLAQAYTVVFPAGSHGALLDGKCQDQVILSFLENPARPPDTSCLAENQQVTFFTPQNVIDFPVAIQLLNLEGYSALQFLVYLAAMLFLLTGWLIFPFAWLIRKLSPPPQAKANPYAPPIPSSAILSEDAIAPQHDRPSWLIRLSSWLALINSLLASAFLLGVAWTIYQMVTENDNRLFFGLPIEARPWFLLVWLIGLLSVVMLLAAWRGWRFPTWGVLRRLYYTLLSLAALSCSAVLVAWGAFTALF